MDDRLGETLLDSVSDRQLGAVAFLLDQGVDINYTDIDGWTSLMLASTKGHLDMIKLLLEYGADTNISSKQGGTALGLSYRHRYMHITKLLILYGASK